MKMKGTNSLSFILHKKLDRIREGLNIRPETLKLLEEERSKTLQNIGINYFFFPFGYLKVNSLSSVVWGLSWRECSSVRCYLIIKPIKVSRIWWKDTWKDSRYLMCAPKELQRRLDCRDWPGYLSLVFVSHPATNWDKMVPPMFSSISRKACREEPVLRGGLTFLWFSRCGNGWGGQPTEDAGSTTALCSFCTRAPCGHSSFLLFVFIVKERIPLGGVSGFSCPQSDREIPKLFCLSAFSQDDRYSERVGSLFAQVPRNWGGCRVSELSNPTGRCP